MSSAQARTLLTGLLAAFVWIAVAAGSDSVGGADSAGYFAQADRWRRGSLIERLPLEGLPVSDSAWLQSPLGFRPSADDEGTVPTYPPGWPVLLALARTAGDTVAIRVLPGAFGVLSLIALYTLARAWLRRPAALCGTTLVASSAPWLFQALQPMSDVPALAAWLSALAAVQQGTWRWRVVGGCAAAVAIGIRPNLAPLLLVVGWMSAGAARPALTALRRAAPAVVPGLAASVAYVVWQWLLYGTPAQSGYGTASELFSLQHVHPNLLRQGSWIVESHGWPAILILAIGVIATLVRRSVPASVASAGVIVWSLYLFYVPFDSWTYLRFLLLPLALTTLAGIGALDAGLARLGRAAQILAYSGLLLVATWANLFTARQLGVFDLHRHEARYRLSAAFVRDHAPPGAVVLAAQHSGALAAYTRLPVLRLDLLHATEAAGLLRWMQAQARPVVLVMDEDERHLLRPLAAEVDEFRLDWPPRAIVGRPSRTKVWLLDDRDAARSGTAIITTPIWPERR